MKKIDLFGPLAVAALFVASCNASKPPVYSVSRGTAESAGNPGPKAVEAKPIEIIFDTKKLLEAPGLYDVAVKFSKGSEEPKVIQNTQITPTGSNATLSIKTEESTAGLLLVSFSQGKDLKFVAKRSNTKLAAGTPVVIDDCLVLPAPWTGGENNGSCEWTVEEVAN